MTSFSHLIEFKIILLNILESSVRTISKEVKSLAMLLKSFPFSSAILLWSISGSIWSSKSYAPNMGFWECLSIISVFIYLLAEFRSSRNLHVTWIHVFLHHQAKLLIILKFQHLLGQELSYIFCRWLICCNVQFCQSCNQY